MRQRDTSSTNGYHATIEQQQQQLPPRQPAGVSANTTTCMLSIAFKLQTGTQLNESVSSTFNGLELNSTNV